jgi:AcrR family transcriptional regulator
VSDASSAVGASRARARRDPEATRRKVIDAAIESILEVGYYESSSNEIARRAGVTWGVIQHQFGTREALLLDVLDDMWARLQESVQHADVGTGPLEKRLGALLEVLAAHYGSNEHLVAMQIGLDLAHNPNTSAQTRRAVIRHADRLARAWHPLSVNTLGPLAEQPDLVAYTFGALRGYLIGNTIAREFGPNQRDATERVLLVEGIAASLRAEARRRGLPHPS